MVDFSTQDVKILEQLVIAALKTSTEESSVKRLEDLRSKVSSLANYELKIDITQKQLDNLNKVMEELNKLVNDYVEKPFTDVEAFDTIKREMAGYLESLSTLKDIFLNAASFNEEILKKQIRVELIDLLQTEEGYSFTKAKEYVEKDARYTAQRDRLEKLRRISTSIKTKYDYYMKIWQGVIQSVSTASKENYTSKTSS